MQFASRASGLFADSEVDVFATVGKYYTVRFNIREGSRLHRITNTDLAVIAFGCGNKNVVGRTSLRKKMMPFTFSRGIEIPRVADSTG